jgi:MFS family permease
VLVAVFGIREKRRSHTASGAELSEPSLAVGHSSLASDQGPTTNGLQPLKRSTVQPRPADGVKPNRAKPDAVKLPRAFYVVLFAVTLFSLGNSSDMFLVMRAQNAGIPVALAPLLVLVFNLTYTLGSWPAGWLSDRFSRGFSQRSPSGRGSSRSGSSRRWIAAAGYLIFAGVYFVFGRAPSALAIWIAMAVYGLYYALTQPVLKALVVEAVGEDVRGRALGVYFFATSVATLAASLITGELWKHYGAGVPFFCSAVLAVVSAALLVIKPASD